MAAAAANHVYVSGSSDCGVDDACATASASVAGTAASVDVVGVGGSDMEGSVYSTRGFSRRGPRLGRGPHLLGWQAIVVGVGRCRILRSALVLGGRGLPAISGHGHAASLQSRRTCSCEAGGG